MQSNINLHISATTQCFLVLGCRYSYTYGPDVTHWCKRPQDSPLVANLLLCFLFVCLLASEFCLFVCFFLSLFVRSFNHSFIFLFIYLSIPLSIHSFIYCFLLLFLFCIKYSFLLIRKSSLAGFLSQYTSGSLPHV